MQYLLTEEEMAAIRREREVARIMPNLEALTNVCQHVACNMIDTDPPNGGKVRDRPYGCIHVRNGQGHRTAMYCDRCPVRGICPQPKDWSQ